MFRGRTIWVPGLMRWLALSAALVFAPVAEARSVGRNSGTASGKMAAPTQEDHASYFSENRRGVSAEALTKADKLRRKSIESIQALIEEKKNSNSVRRFELILRLGELYVERHDYLRDIEMESWTKAHDTWGKEKKGAEPKLDVKGSEGELTKAANSFRKLVNEFPKHPRTDAALYSLARTLARLNKETAVDYYKQLIKSHPKSPLIPDTYLSLGEYYFDKHNVPEAISCYQKVMNFKSHRAYPYAVYKLGWAFYNAPAKSDDDTKANLGKAVAAFKLVIKLQDKDKDLPKSNFNLRDEAIRDLIMVWADAEDVASAWKYFKTIGEQDAFYKMLERLGNIYAEQGKNQQAIAVFQRLLKDAPNRDGNPQVHAKVVELYDLTNNIGQVVAELKDMQKSYLGNTPWVKANGKRREGADADQALPTEEAKRVVELNLHRYGAMFHQRGQKAKSDGYLKSAAAVYAMYLESFASNPNAYDIRYYLAEILFDFKQYDSASHHYMIVAKVGPSGKYMKPAALNAVAAMHQLVASTKYPALPPLGQVPKPIEVPSAKKKLVEVIDTYVGLLPKEKDGEPMRFAAAQTYFEHGHYPEAIKRFALITGEIPETKQGKAAVKVILGYYGDREDWNKLISWSQRFVKNDKLMDTELRKYVTDLLRGSMFKRALAYEKAGKYERSARSFIEYQKEFPTDGNADRALYNATLNFFKIGKVENALSTGNMLLEKYPKSAVAPDVIVTQATTYESLAKFDKAAENYARLSAHFPGDKRSPEAHYNAAVLYKGLKQFDRAAELFADFVKKYPTHQAAAGAQMEVAALAERRGKQADAIRAYGEFAQKHRTDVEANLEAQAKAAVLKTFSANAADGKRDLDRVTALLVQKDAPPAFEARAAVASALFKLAEPMFADFQGTRISDGSKIEQQVGAKQEKLVKLAAVYEKIIDIGSGEHTVASLYRLGEAHENFSSALFKAPAPRGSSQGDVDKLKTELEKVAFPLKEEAYKFFETAYRRSKEVQTFTVWTRRTYQKMVDLSPEKHPAVDEISAEPAYMSHDLKMSKAVSELIEE